MTQEEKNEAIGIAFQQLRDWIDTCSDAGDCGADILTSTREYIEEVLQEC